MRTLAVLLAAVLFAACGGGAGSSDSPAAPTPATESAPGSAPASGAEQPGAEPAPEQPATPAAMPLAEAETIVSRIVALMTELGIGLDDATGDCDAIARVITEWYGRHADEIARLETRGQNIPPEYAQGPLAQHFMALEEQAGKLARTAQECADHPAYTEALEKLQGS